MTAVPISRFEHRVAKWASRLRKERRPLEITQRGKGALIVLSKDLYEEWQKEREWTRALEIRLLIAAAERDFEKGRFYTHEQVGRMLGLTPRRKKPR